MRRILPSGELSDCALPRAPCWSLPPPPSPVPTYMSLSGPKTIRPPLWLGSGSSMRSTRRALPGVGAVVAGAVVLPDRLGAALLGVVDVEQPRLRVVRGEGHREQALLAAGRDLRADVEERLGHGLAAAHDDDLPRLLDHEDPPPVARRRGDVERALEVADLDQAHAAPGRRAALGRAGAARVVVGARRRVGARGGVLGVRVRATGRDERGGRRGRARRQGGASAQDAMAL